MSAIVISSVKVLHMAMCAVCLECLLNGLYQSPQLSFWEFTQAEPHCQYKPGKPGRWGWFCYWYFFSAWPFYNLSTQASPSCLIWLNWPEQWRLENYCCGFNSQAGERSFEGTIHSVIWGLSWKNKQGLLSDFYQTTQLPCYTVAAELSSDNHSQQDSTFSLSWTVAGV